MTSEPRKPTTTSSKKKKDTATDHDSPWKEALEYYFQDFLELLFPEIAQAINWQHPPEFLDKELQKIVKQAQEGRQYADKLVKVQLNDGQETWLLIHVEVQGEPETAFELRMYTYYHRILSRYKIEVVSLAVLADTDPHFKPSHYQTERFGCELHFTFPSVKLLEWENRWEELEASHNRFAPVVMAQILAKRLHPKNQAQERKTVKLKLVKSLYEKGYSKTDILELFRVIDWMINLPYTLEEAFTEELAAYEEAKVMPYITSVERRGIEKGIEQGIEQGYQKAQAEAEKRLQEEKQAAEQRMTQAVMNLFGMGLSEEQIAQSFQISIEEVQAIKQQNQH